MTKKINCILLIDDDESTNFINGKIIERSKCCEKIVSIQNASDALVFLKTKTDGQFPCPDLVFLDINMPGMNGWEFLEEYKNLSPEQKGNIIIVMLSTSCNPEDANKAKFIQEVSEFKSKPLTAELLREILTTYFPVAIV